MELAGKLYFRELERLQNLEEDLSYLRGSPWKEIPVPDASKACAKSLRELMIDHPHRLVAHACVRYPGDLSGGQILKKIARIPLGLDRQGFASIISMGSSMPTCSRRAIAQGRIHFPSLKKKRRISLMRPFCLLR